MTTIGADCLPASRITKSLLGYGVAAGPLYLTVSLAQAATRDGFDLRRHAWSLLSNGALGWIQISNFLLTGAMVVAFALGLRRAVAAKAWVLVAAFGASMIGAGFFRADPAAGFPAGTPDTAPLTWHGMLHFMVGGAGFICLAIACLLLGARYARAGRGAWAWFSRVTGILFLAAFAGIASGSGTPAVVLSFVTAVTLVFTWMSCVAVDTYKSVH